MWHIRPCILVGHDKSIEEYNQTKKQKVLLVFDDIIADIISKKKLSIDVSEMFFRDTKWNISLVFITQLYF